MRVIDLYLDESKAREIADIARDLGQRVVTYETDDHVGVRIVVSEGSPDELLEDLRERLDPDADDFYVVSEALAMAPRPEPDEREESRAATDEIESFVEEGAQFTKSFAVLSSISGVLATAGLITDSPAVLVGAMVLAPLFKPIASVGAGIVLGRTREVLRAALLLAGALAMAAAAGAVVTLVTPGADATGAVVARTGVSPFDLVIALATGVAMAYALLRRDAMTMVGIVVAASLIPVASALGVAFALWDLPLVGGAGVTLASAVSGMLIGLIATCKFEELRTADYAERRLGKRLSDRVLWAGVGVLVVLVAINAWVFLAGPAASLTPESLQRFSAQDERIVATVITTDRSAVLYVDPSTSAEDRRAILAAAAEALGVDEPRVALAPLLGPAR